MTKQTKSYSTLVKKIIKKIQADLLTGDQTSLTKVFDNVSKEALVNYLKDKTINSKISFILIDNATKQSVDDLKYHRTVAFEELLLTIDDETLSEFLS